MKIKVSQLYEGLTVEKDVMGMTKHPIITANTVLERKHIQFLEAFLKKEIYIKEMIVTNGLEDITDSNTSGTAEKKDFIQTYEHAVKAFTTIFQSLQYGASLDVAAVSELFRPLLSFIDEEDDSVLAINTYPVEKENYIYHHCIGMGIWSSLIAKQLGSNKGEYYQIGFAGVLANVGMSKISPSILNKRSVLTSEEREEMQQHVFHSLNLINSSMLLKNEYKSAILQHHEFIDGSGYPKGLKNEEILYAARIFSVADAFHALTHNRLFKQGVNIFEAVELLKIDSFGKYGVSVMQALISIVTSKFIIGTKVILSNGETAEIVFMKQHEKTRPVVRLQNDELLDLERHRSLSIQSVMRY